MFKRLLSSHKVEIQKRVRSHGIKFTPAPLAHVHAVLNLNRSSRVTQQSLSLSTGHACWNHYTHTFPDHYTSPQNIDYTKKPYNHELHYNYSHVGVDTICNCVCLGVCVREGERPWWFALFVVWFYIRHGGLHLYTVCVLPCTGKNTSPCGGEKAEFLLVHCLCAYVHVSECVCVCYSIMWRSLQESYGPEPSLEEWTSFLLVQACKHILLSSTLSGSNRHPPPLGYFLCTESCTKSWKLPRVIVQGSLPSPTAASGNIVGIEFKTLHQDTSRLKCLAYVQHNRKYSRWPRYKPGGCVCSSCVYVCVCDCTYYTRMPGRAIVDWDSIMEWNCEPCGVCILQWAALPGPVSHPTPHLTPPSTSPTIVFSFSPLSTSTPPTTHTHTCTLVSPPSPLWNTTCY